MSKQDTMREQYIERIKKAIESLPAQDLRFLVKLAELRAGKPKQE